MDTISKEAIEKSVRNRLNLAGFTDEAQVAAWLGAVETLAEKMEAERIAEQPVKEQANYRQLLGMCRSAFAIELKAYQKYMTDRKKGATAENAGVSLRSRLENQQTPVIFV